MAPTVDFESEHQTGPEHLDSIVCEHRSGDLVRLGRAVLSHRLETYVDRGTSEEIMDSEMVVERHAALVTQIQRQRSTIEQLEHENTNLTRRDKVRCHHGSTTMTYLCGTGKRRNCGKAEARALQIGINIAIQCPTLRNFKPKSDR